MNWGLTLSLLSLEMSLIFFGLCFYHRTLEAYSYVCINQSCLWLAGFPTLTWNGTTHKFPSPLSVILAPRRKPLPICLSVMSCLAPLLSLLTVPRLQMNAFSQSRAQSENRLLLKPQDKQHHNATMLINIVYIFFQEKSSNEEMNQMWGNVQGQGNCESSRWPIDPVPSWNSAQFLQTSKLPSCQAPCSGPPLPPRPAGWFDF